METEANKATNSTREQGKEKLEQKYKTNQQLDILDNTIKMRVGDWESEVFNPFDLRPF